FAVHRAGGGEDVGRRRRGFDDVGEREAAVGAHLPLHGRLRRARGSGAERHGSAGIDGRARGRLRGDHGQHVDGERGGGGPPRADRVGEDGAILLAAVALNGREGVAGRGRGGNVGEHRSGRGRLHLPLHAGDGRIGAGGGGERHGRAADDRL